MGVCNCSMFCCSLLYVHFSIAIILMGKRKLVALLNLSSWCLVMVERLFLAVPWGCLQFVIVVFPDHIHLLFFMPFFSIKKVRIACSFTSATYFSLPFVLWHIFIYIHTSIIERSTTRFGLHKLFNINITCHIYFVFKDNNTIVINLSYQWLRNIV